LWEDRRWAEFYEQLAGFSRLIVFDRRGIGLSDRVSGAPPLEERMDDVRAVLDAVESERAALFGSMDGGAILTLFAATYPERTAALVLFSMQPRWTSAPGYPWGLSADEARRWLKDGEERFGDADYIKDLLRRMVPSAADDDDWLEWSVRDLRLSASPGALAALRRMNVEIDIRDVLPTIRVPTLVLQRRDEEFVGAEVARYVAEAIPRAVYRELAGADLLPWMGDAAGILDAVRSFVELAWVERDGLEAESERVLTTILFTDIVGSTEKAVELGDAAWRSVLRDHHAHVRRNLIRFRGREIDTAGDGFFATFDGPARAIRCACTIVDESEGVVVRAGVHTGECELVDGKMGGIAVHIGARVAALASGSEVLVSRTVKDLVAGSGIEFEGRGAHPLKGIPGNWQLYAVKA
jgi:class 3 adenylate cyclase